MTTKTIWLAKTHFPPLLREIPKPPKILNYRGKLPKKDLSLLSVVGSRKYSIYGKQVLEHLLSGLRDYKVGIVSGLALGLDSLAHEEALRNDLYTLAIPGGGINGSVIYPATHRPLARRILETGGALLSEFNPSFKATKWSFPQRNRLVAGISQATLLIEAAEKSGTLITARLATDFNRELLVVPGNIFSKNCQGVHQFLKLGATPVTHASDIIEIMNLKKIDTQNSHHSTSNTKPEIIHLSDTEKTIIKNLTVPTHRDQLIRQIHLPATEIMQTLTMMELKQLVKSEQNVYHLILDNTKNLT